MRDKPSIVVNTGPVLALVAATGDLEIMRRLYDRVVVPYEVISELEASDSRPFGVDVLARSTWLIRRTDPATIPALLSHSLDRGEAAVIQVAMEERIGLVCIDEAAGRRVARLSGLTVTGSIGVVLRAMAEGYPLDLEAAIVGMRSHGIWLSDRVVEEARRMAATIRDSSEVR